MAFHNTEGYSLINTNSLVRLDALMVSLSMRYTDTFISDDSLKLVETSPSSDAFFYPSQIYYCNPDNRAALYI